MTFRHGLVVGKFYPPHRGHADLISRAADACDQVTVVVAAASCESIGLGSRVEWLGWEFADRRHVAVVGAMDDHPVDYDDPVAWDAHMAVFTGAIDEVAADVPVDAVFTGESYGDELARRLRATHVRVERGEAGPSGTAARADLAAAWPTLLPAARVGLARRIVVVGAESTGTSTLATALADAVGAELVGEYGRYYSAGKLADARERAHDGRSALPWMDDLVWSSDEFTHIAAVQTAAIADAATRGPVVIADTDALATSVWHDRYVGGPHHPALALARRRPPHLYLLTSPDGVEFHDDGLRDGPHLRQDMTERFESVLGQSGTTWVRVTGSPGERLQQALEVSREALRLPELAPPLG